MEDGALLARCARGDSRAWDALVTRYERLVYAVPVNAGLRGEDAADVTQATFAALARAIGTLERPDRVSAWLVTVAKRQTIRVLERRDRERIAVEAHEPAVSDESVHRLAADVEWLHQGLSAISPRCRDVLVEMFFTDRSYRDVAEHLGMSIGSMGSLRGRCLAQLRAALEERYDAEG